MLALVGCSEATELDRLVPKMVLDTRSLDFGEVPVGMTKRAAIQVSNPGGLPLTLSAVLTSTVFEGAVTELVIAPGSTVPLVLSFAPSRGGRVEDTLHITSNADNADCAVTGTGVPGFATITPRAVELSTRVMTTRSVELVITNHGVTPLSGDVRPLQFVRPESYAVSATLLTSGPQFTVPASGEATFRLDYAPIVVGDDSGQVMFELCGPACGLEVDVRARASSGALRADPAAIDFGAVGIDEKKLEPVTLFNDGSTPIQITALTIEGTSEALVKSIRPLPITLRPGSATVLSIEYTPRSPAAMRADLVVATDNPDVGEAHVALSGHGIGALMEVQPANLDFGVVRREVAQRRSFLVVNSGSVSFRITELSFVGHPSMRLAAAPGLPARLDPGDTLVSSVELVPTGTNGLYLGEVTVRADRADLPVIKLPVRAVFTEPNCRLDVAPDTVTFGLLEPGSTASLDVQITNVGVRDCILENGAMLEPSDPVFSVAPVSWPIALTPGQNTRVTFTYAPTEPREAKSTYRVTTDDAGYREHSIRLVGTAQEAIVPPAAGRFLFYWQIGRSGDIMRVPLQGSPVPTPYWGTRTGKQCSGCHSISPDGRYLAIVGLGNIDIVDTRTQQAVAGSRPVSSLTFVSWNPDVNTSPPYQFAYGDNDAIQISSAQGGQVHTLRGADEPNFGHGMPTWGPGKIAFVRGTQGNGLHFWGPTDIMIVDEAGGVAVPLAGASLNNGGNFYPKFSPNGRWIAYNHSPSAGGTVSVPDARVQLVRADNSGTVLTLPLLNTASGATSFPTWAVDGTYLSFSSNRPGGAGGWDIYIAPIDPVSGTEGMPRNLAEVNTAEFEHAAVWSP